MGVRCLRVTTTPCALRRTSPSRVWHEVLRPAWRRGHPTRLEGHPPHHHHPLAVYWCPHLLVSIESVCLQGSVARIRGCPEESSRCPCLNTVARTRLATTDLSALLATPSVTSPKSAPSARQSTPRNSSRRPRSLSKEGVGQRMDMPVDLCVEVEAALFALCGCVSSLGEIAKGSVPGAQEVQ